MWIGIVLGCLLLIAYVVIRITFPPQKVKALVISQLEAALKRQVSIGAVHLNPIRGFTLDDVVIYQQQPGQILRLETLVFFRSNRLQLRYRISPLIKKRLEIKNILIDTPELNLHQDKNYRWNFDDLLATDTTAARSVPVDTSAAEYSLPVSFHLKKFALKNLKTNIFIDQIDTSYSIQSGTLSLEVADLFLPRQSLDAFRKNVRAKLKLFSGPEPWRLVLNPGDS